VLVDCPPSLNLLTLNAMAAAHSILVPLQTEFFALEGLSQLLNTVDQVRRSINPALEIQGIVLTMFDKRNNLAQQVVEDVRAHLGDKVYETIIPRNVRVSEAPSHGKPAILYDLGCARQPGLSSACLGSYPARTAADAGLSEKDETNGKDMADDASRKRLGRGLAALIGEMDQPVEEAPKPHASDRILPIEFVVRNPNNPRREFSEDDLSDLAASVREHGIIQPIVVREQAQQPGTYELIAGERRWRAAQRAGLVEIPVIIRNVDDKVALELAIIENVQRSDLNPIEEAAGYQKLIDDYSYTQADLGDVIGKSRSHVANTLRLLKLPAKRPVDGQPWRFVGRSCPHAGDRDRSGSAGTAHRRRRPVGAPGGSAGTNQSALIRTKGKPGAEGKGRRYAGAGKIADGPARPARRDRAQQKRRRTESAYKTLDQLDSLCHRLQGV
jgi:ParB family chromosome partitioning protein